MVEFSGIWDSIPARCLKGSAFSFPYLGNTSYNRRRFIRYESESSGVLVIAPPSSAPGIQLVARYRRRLCFIGDHVNHRNLSYPSHRCKRHSNYYSTRFQGATRERQQR